MILKEFTYDGQTITYYSVNKRIIFTKVRYFKNCNSYEVLLNSTKKRIDITDSIMSLTNIFLNNFNGNFIDFYDFFKDFETLVVSSTNSNFFGKVLLIKKNTKTVIKLCNGLPDAWIYLNTWQKFNNSNNHIVFCSNQDNIKNILT